MMHDVFRNPNLLLIIFYLLALFIVKNKNNFVTPMRKENQVSQDPLSLEIERYDRII